MHISCIYLWFNIKVDLLVILSSFFAEFSDYKVITYLQCYNGKLCNFFRIACYLSVLEIIYVNLKCERKITWKSYVGVA